ncbi:unnamed protein product [Kluyveromyces dobzhanskii CBS 2104]|uniref:WGS project CCBQ000000000 data, contig 00058 n=1 Tax=Kluyveromyces dobzhanskii CBS 2104 TaxID=1427455 RepID=A0A0A8LBQ7_9SACH|nr:unnamed protein product [Kluyveromyces dobzhanskii CBS 2104]
MPSPQLFGRLVDDQSRCEHWHGPLDVIALRFKCCNKYYACHQCHQELESHTPIRYSITEKSVPLIACGVCRLEMSFADYSRTLQCPKCSSQFNPGCKLHYDMYFIKVEAPV